MTAFQNGLALMISIPLSFFFSSFLSFIKTADNNMAATFPRPLQNQKSPEEKLAELESLPLFMKSLPEDTSDDPVISALQNLAHEGTPDGRHFSVTSSLLFDWFQAGLQRSP